MIVIHKRTGFFARSLRHGARVAAFFLASFICPTGTVFATCDANPNTCNLAEAGKLRQGGQLSYAIDKNVSNWNLLSSQGNVLETGWVLSGLLPRTFITAPDLTVAMNNELLDSAKVTATYPETIVYKVKPNAIWSQ